MITLETIEDEYQKALDECGGVIPFDKWSIRAKAIKLTRHKTKYGIATSRGEVFVSQAFINTTAINKLRNTLRHELAHLAVGLAHGHNRIFKQCARDFGAMNAVDPAEIQAMDKAIGYKWQLLAHLVNGHTVDMGRVHRRHKKYAAYIPRRRVFMTIKDVVVQRFEYVAA